MDELRHQPHSVEAEQGVLGSILLNARCIEETSLLLGGDDFYLPVHRDIYDTLYAMFAAGDLIDPVTALDAMKTRGVYKEPDSRNYFHRLMTDTPSSAHVRHYAEIVKEHSMRRQILDTAADITAMAAAGEEEAADVIDAAEARFFSLRSHQFPRTLTPIPEVLTQVLQHVRAMYEAGGRLPGVPSGFPTLDSLLGGLMDSNFIILAARPGVGKTSLALNIAAHAARFAGKTMAFFSLEMSRDQLAARMLSSEAEIEATSLLRGSLSDPEFDRLGAAASALARLPIQFDDNADISVQEMKAKCRRVKNLGMIIIDYLQLMHGTPGKRYDNRNTEVGDISRSLKIMAKELNVPVLCLSQLRRAPAGSRDQVTLSDLRDSGSIEQDADVVLFIQAVRSEDGEGPGDDEMELLIGKNRHGDTGRVRLGWNKRYTRFFEVDWRHDDL